IDTEEHLTHKLHSYCVNLREAQFVIGHFVRDDRTDHLGQNALTALLVGIALGFGRRVLVLQEGPVRKPMIDLKGVIHKYETESQAEKIIEEVIGAWKPQIEVERSKRTAKAMFTATQSAALSLGSATAENDELLDECFM